MTSCFVVFRAFFSSQDLYLSFPFRLWIPRLRDQPHGFTVSNQLYSQRPPSRAASFPCLYLTTSIHFFLCLWLLQPGSDSEIIVVIINQGDRASDTRKPAADEPHARQRRRWWSPWEDPLTRQPATDPAKNEPQDAATI